ncbi:MAG: hypothetical protein V3T88_05695, partial [Nitrosomonadaceae bacterium]
MREPSPRRERKSTEKGRQYTMDGLEKERNSSFQKLNRHMSIMRPLLSPDEKVDVETMTGHYRDWLSLYEHFLNAHDGFCKLLTVVELEDYRQTWFAERDDRIRDFKVEVDTWFTSHRRSGVTQLQDAARQPCPPGAVGGFVEQHGLPVDD